MRSVVAGFLACALAHDATAFAPFPALRAPVALQTGVNKCRTVTFAALAIRPVRGHALKTGVALRAAPSPFTGGPSKWDDPNFDPTKESIDSDVPLHLAAYYGKVDEVKRLLEAGADVNQAQDTGWTGLMWAARGNRPEVLQVLKDRGGDLYAQNKFGSTPLHAAAHWGSEECTKLLLGWMEADKIDTTNAFGWTALHWAGKGGHPEAAALLIKAGAKVNARNMKGNTPLHEACHNGKLEIMQTLLDNGSDVHAKTNDGETPLHIAAYLGFVDACNVLLKAGAVPDPLDAEEASPLYRAARGGEVEVVEMLLKAGADPNKKAANGWTALHEASRWGREPVVEVLVQAGADVNVRNQEDSTPLHLATLFGRACDDPEVLDMLMEAGADPSAKDSRGQVEILKKSQLVCVCVCVCKSNSKYTTALTCENFRQTPLDIATAEVDKDEWEVCVCV